MGEAAAAGAAPHSEAAADPEAATNQRVPETARKVDPSAPGSAPGTPQGQHCTEQFSRRAVQHRRAQRSMA